MEPVDGARGGEGGEARENSTAHGHRIEPILFGKFNQFLCEKLSAREHKVSEMLFFGRKKVSAA